MTVRELIEALERHDPDANVLLGIQPSWPFEHRIRGLAARRDFADVDDELAEEPTDSFSTDGRPNDVLICEGGQVRYGDRSMFDACSEW